MKGKNKELDKVKVLILGSKEFPMEGRNGEDVHPSGGIEVYTENLVSALNRYDDIVPVVITRKFKETQANERKPCEVFQVPWIKGRLLRGPSFNFFALFKALSLAYDVILAQGPMAGLSSLLLMRIKGCRAIIRAAGVSFTQPQYPFRSIIKKIETFVYSRAQCVIFGSESEREKFERIFGFLPPRWVVIPTGIEIIKSKKEPNNIIRIAFVGRIVKVKGIDYLIEAAKSLKQEFKLLIIGDGPERQNLTNLAKPDNRIKFLGFRNDVRDILAKTDIFVLPSLSEGVPIALLEAMAAGCACVVTRIGLPVSDGKDGLVVEPGDSSDLAIAIEKLMTDKDLRKAMQEGGQQFIRENHSLEKMGEMYSDLFRACVRSRVTLNSTSSKSCRH